MSSSRSIESPRDPTAETVVGLFVSLGFWFSLSISAILFALVALSPKLLANLNLRHQYEANHSQLVAAEQQAEQLKRVVDAIQADKEFSVELTRVELDAVRLGEEVLPVENELKLDTTTDASMRLRPSITSPWYEPTVTLLARDTQLRMALLSVAAVLLIASFTILQPVDAKSRNLATKPKDSIWRSLSNRYVRQY